MGIIAAFILGINVEARISLTNVTADDIAAVGRINIHSFTSNTDILSSIRYEHISDPMIEYSHSAVDFLWFQRFIYFIENHTHIKIWDAT